jgi:hypothetical protein
MGWPFSRSATQPEITQVGTLDSLIRDCDLAVSYAIARGKSVDRGFLEGIRLARLRGTNFSWTDPEAVALQDHLPKVLTAIAPITIFDLRHHINLDDKRSLGSRKALLLVAVALALLVAIANYTLWIDRANAVVQEIAKDKKGETDRLMDDILPILPRLVSANSSAILTEATAAERIVFRDRRRQIVKLVSQVLSDDKEFMDATADFPGVLETIDDYKDFQSKLSTALFPPQTGAANAAEAPQDSKTPQPGTRGQQIAANYEKCLGNSFVVLPVVSNAENAAAAPPQTAVSAQLHAVLVQIQAFAAMVTQDNDIDSTVRCLIGLSHLEKLYSTLANGDSSAQVAPGTSTPQFNGNTLPLTRKINMASLWILPALYGMLGAAIFHLRQQLDPFRPNPPMPRVVLRLFLSAFTGVAIAWFWRPDADGQIEIAELTFGLASLAFLVGYSIEIFFNLLDRWVFLANSNIATIGGHKTS